MSDSQRPITPPKLPPRGRKTEDPRLIGPWKVGRTIGSGACGRVRIARHAKTGKYAAIKIVSKNQVLQSQCSFGGLEVDAERLLLYLEREIVVMKLIDHPNILRLYDVWEHSGVLYLILEYVEGGELFDYMCERGRLPASEALDYFQQLIGAVHYCHRLSIAHRDLKPENLLLDKDKILKVADFGMAAWQGGNNSDLLKSACGSPHYAAPEVISKLPYDGLISDVWSCGVILYVLLAGKLPFDGDDWDVILLRVGTGRFDMPRDIDPGAQDLLRKMLEKDVAKRITISDILVHPWYTSQAPRVPSVLPSLDDYSGPISNACDIDVDILGNLRTLWHDAPDEDIIEALMNDEQTWEKAVYFLLLKYRMKCQENADEELKRAQALRRSERKQRRLKDKQERKEKRALEDQLVDHERPETPMQHPVRPDPPTPRRAANNRDEPSQSSPPLPSLTPRTTLRPVRQLPHTTSAQATQSLPNPSPFTPSFLTPTSTVKSPLAPTSPGSPIWEVLDVPPPMDVPELHDENVQRYFQQIIDQLNITKNLPGVISPALGNRYTPASATSALQPPRLLPTLRNSEVPPSTPAGYPQTAARDIPQKDVRGLGISTASRDSGKENGKRVMKKSSLRKSREDGGRRALADRHVQIVLPPPIKRNAKEPQHGSCDSYTSHSPTFSLSEGSSFSGFSSAPKRSWFMNLFKVRPATFSLVSVHDAAMTREACRRMLTRFGVHVVEDLRGGFLRCQLDEVRDSAGVMSVAKAARFRVEVRALDARQAAEAGYAVALEMVLEKGALSSFRLVHERLRRVWDLDAVYGDLETDYARSPVPPHGAQYRHSPKQRRSGNYYY
ncbi:kinase-like domain-containing protein [Phellopilus nigrolimitatus]|nr:kinase-like domain-containing protein [Phellopilus nigrolimitatus]